MKGFSGIILLLAVTTAHGGTVRGPGRIVGGFPVQLSLVPYQVSLQYQDAHICGGNIPPRFTMSRGLLYNLLFSPKRFNHSAEVGFNCGPLYVRFLEYNGLIHWHFFQQQSAGTYGLPAAYFTVRAGTDLLQTGGEVIKVTKVIQHSQFNRITYDFDFCLLQLATKLTLDGKTKAAIPLPPANLPIPENTAFLVSGWGYTLSSESRSKLRAVVVTTDNQDVCNQKYAYDGGVTGQMVCASDAGKDSCNVRASLKRCDRVEWLLWIYLQGDSGETW